MEPDQNQAQTNEGVSNMHTPAEQDIPQQNFGITDKNPKNTNKKIIFIIVGVLLLLSMAGGIFILLTSKEEPSKETHNTNNAQLGDNVQTRLDTIKSELQALGAETDVDRSQISVDFYMEEDEKKNIVKIPSDIYVNYPSTNGTELYDSIVEVLTKNNLVKVAQADEQRYDSKYQDTDIVCVAFANVNYARVNCVSKSRFLSFKNESLNVVSATESVLGVTLGNYSIDFFENSDKTLTGATISGRISAQEYINTVYLSNSGSGWRYIAQASKGMQAEIQPACDGFSDEEQILFKETGLLCEDVTDN